MSFDGQNEILISEDEWCGLLARIASMEKELSQMQSYCEALILELGLNAPPWLEPEYDLPLPSPDCGEDSEIAPKLIAWLCGKGENPLSFENGSLAPSEASTSDSATWKIDM